MSKSKFIPGWDLDIASITQVLNESWEYGPDGDIVFCGTAHEILEKAGQNCARTPELSRLIREGTLDITDETHIYRYQSRQGKGVFGYVVEKPKKGDPSGVNNAEVVLGLLMEGKISEETARKLIAAL